jgi:hypothetical protein
MSYTVTITKGDKCVSFSADAWPRVTEIMCSALTRLLPEIHYKTLAPWALTPGPVAVASEQWCVSAEPSGQVVQEPLL